MKSKEHNGVPEERVVCMARKATDVELGKSPFWFMELQIISLAWED